MTPPHVPGRSGTPFATWLSRTWAEIVDHPDPETETPTPSGRDCHRYLVRAASLRPQTARHLLHQNIPHQTPTATRNTNTSSPKPGRNPGTAPAASGACSACAKPLPPWRSAKDTPAGSCAAGHASKPLTETSVAAFPPLLSTQRLPKGAASRHRNRCRHLPQSPAAASTLQPGRA